MLRQINDNVIALKFPEGAYGFQIHGPNDKKDRLLWYAKDGYVSNEYLPPGKWKILGKLDELTDQDKEKCVSHIGWDPFKEYLDYRYGSFTFTTAIESFQSLLDANKLYSVNPLGEKEPEIREYTNDELEGLPSIKEWQAAEDNTGDWLIILREGE
jgi:hypothetical protein